MVMRAEIEEQVASLRNARGGEGAYVLPAPPRGRRDQLVIEPEPTASSGTWTGDVAKVIGGRLRLQAESLELLLDELKERLGRLDEAVEGSSRAQLKGSVRELMQVVGWCEAAQRGLALECKRTQAGQEPIDLVALCEHVASERDDDEQIVVESDGVAACWGYRARVRRLLGIALDLVWARTQQRGLRCVEVLWEEGVPCVRVRSCGEPGRAIDPELVGDFRAAAEMAGVCVSPDGLGPGGAGLILRFPRAMR